MLASALHADAFFPPLSHYIEEKLDAWTKELTQADAVLLRKREELYKPLWEKRDEIINKIDGFWPQAVSSGPNHLRGFTPSRPSICSVCSCSSNVPPFP